MFLADGQLRVACYYPATPLTAVCCMLLSHIPIDSCVLHVSTPQPHLQLCVACFYPTTPLKAVCCMFLPHNPIDSYLLHVTTPQSLHIIPALQEAHLWVLL